MILYSFISFLKIKYNYHQKYSICIFDSFLLIPIPGRININIYHVHLHLFLLHIYISINIFKILSFNLHINGHIEYIIFEVAPFCSKYCLWDFTYSFINMATCVSFSKRYSWIIDYVNIHLEIVKNVLYFFTTLQNLKIPYI